LLDGAITPVVLWVADARSSNTVSLVVAISWASLLRASLSGESNLAIAGSVEAISVVTAVSWASIQSTIISSPTSIALAGEVVVRANSVSRASVGADLGGAISTFEPRVAVANSVCAETSIRAVAGACLD